jgi:uncharacterized membrane protein YuzA (DUF378 family)
MASIQTNSAYAFRDTSGLNAIDWVAMVLLIVGGLDWGLIGLFGFNLVAAIFGEMTVASRIVYALVGLSALWSIYTSTRLAGRHRT